MAIAKVNPHAGLMAELRQRYPEINFTLYDHTPDAPDGYIMVATDGDRYKQVSYFDGGYSHTEMADKLVTELKNAT